MLKIAADHIENVVTICNDGMKDNVIQVKALIDVSEASMSKHISCNDPFKAKTVKHQVNTKTEYSKILSDIERLN